MSKMPSLYMDVDNRLLFHYIAKSKGLDFDLLKLEIVNRVNDEIVSSLMTDKEYVVEPINLKVFPNFERNRKKKADWKKHIKIYLKDAAKTIYEQSGNGERASSIANVVTRKFLLSSDVEKFKKVVKPKEE